MSWPISWNEINELIKTPPLAHAETATVELMPETTAKSQNDDMSGLKYMEIAGFAVTAGEYEVTFDGVVYNCTAKHVDDRLVIGNTKILDQNDTGEPFMIISNGPGIMYLPYETSRQDHTVRIVGTRETVTPIDPKFIPTLDYLRLKGANGKTYTVTVDANGALAVAEYVDPNTCPVCTGSGKICGFMSGTIDPATGECSSHGTKCLAECPTCDGSGKLA